MAERNARDRIRHPGDVRPPRKSRPSARLAWILLLLTGGGVLVYGLLAVIWPTMLTAGYESYTGAAWNGLTVRDPVTATYVLWTYRLVGGLNVALGVTLVAIAVIPFRRGEPWAWWTLLAGNLIGYGVPMTYDQITGEIGGFEMLEFVAVAAVFVALAVTAPLGILGRPASRSRSDTRRPG